MEPSGLHGWQQSPAEGKEQAAGIEHQVRCLKLHRPEHQQPPDHRRYHICHGVRHNSTRRYCCPRWQQVTTGIRGRRRVPATASRRRRLQASSRRLHAEQRQAAAALAATLHSRLHEAAQTACRCSASLQQQQQQPAAAATAGCSSTSRLHTEATPVGKQQQRHQSAAEQQQVACRSRARLQQQQQHRLR